MNLENGSGGAAASAVVALVVAKGDFSDTLLENGENAGDGEVIGEMDAGPPSTAAAMVVEEEGGEL